MKADRNTTLRTFIRHLVTATANASLYSADHQQVSRLASAAHTDLVDVLEADEELGFLLIEDNIVVDGIPLPADMYVKRFTRALKIFGVGHIKFSRNVKQPEILHLVANLANKKQTSIESTDNIRLSRVEIKPAEEEETSGIDCPQRIMTVAELAAEGCTVFEEIRDRVRSDQKLNLAGINRIVDTLVYACENIPHPFHALATLRTRDEYTFIHSANVCILTMAQAIHMGIHGSLLNDIGTAGLLHDIGKLYVPDDILNKPGRLTEDEMELIRQHPADGAVYLLDNPGIPRLAVLTAYEHHMKFDNTGYPKVASDWQQNICSQMTAISDFFDALRTKRAYRDAMKPDVIAGKMLAMSGGEFNPALMENFLHLATTLNLCD